MADQSGPRPTDEEARAFRDRVQNIFWGGDAAWDEWLDEVEVAPVVTQTQIPDTASKAAFLEGPDAVYGSDGQAFQDEPNEPDEAVADAPIDPEVAAGLRQMGDFDIGRFIGTVNRADYVDIKYRIVWFRHDWAGGHIRTQLMKFEETHDNKAYAIFKATVDCSALGGPYGEAFGSETRGDFGDFLEKAETKALGRALERCGYGTANALLLAGRAATVRGGKAAPAPSKQRQVSADGEVGYPPPPIAVPGGGKIDDLVGRIRAGQVAPPVWPTFWNENSKGLSREEQKTLTGVWNEYKKSQGS